MSLSIELCKNRGDAEARKAKIKADAPTTKFKTRIIEDQKRVSMYLTKDVAGAGTKELIGSARGNDLGVSKMVVLLIWK